MQTGPDGASGDHEVVAAAARAFGTLMAETRGVLERPQDDGNGAPIANGQILALRVPSAVGRADRLARHLLAYAGGQSLSPAKLELIPFLADLTHTLQRALDVRIDVSVDVGNDCPPCYVDRDALEEALLNLVANARDAMPGEGSLQLSAKAVMAPDGSPAVAVSVADTGTGMAADFAPRAMQPFVTTKTNEPQAGMGLAATDGFARQSGGRLTLSCPVGFGVTATLSLPQSISGRLPTTGLSVGRNDLFALTRDVIESAGDAILTANEGQIIVMANPAAALIFRCSIAELVGAPLERFIPQRYHANHRRDMQHFGDAENAARHMGRAREVMGLRTDGEEFPIDASISHLNSAGRRLYTAILRDMSERRFAETALRESEARLRRVLTLLPEAVVISSGNHLSFVNDAAQRLLGADESALLGRPTLDVFHAGSIELVKARSGALRGGASTVPLVEERIVRPDGTIRIVETTSTLIEDRGEVSILKVMRDVTELLQARSDISDSRRTEGQAHALARIDSLTGLLNRRSLDEHLQAAVARCHRSGRPVALMFIDVDHFKQINDIYGHAVGDYVLKEIAHRIQRCARVTDTVARLGGDEFMILLEGLNCVEDAEVVATKIAAELEPPFVFEKVTLPPVTCSIGVAGYGGDDISAADVAAKADEALYEAKRAGRNRFVVSQWHDDSLP